MSHVIAVLMGLHGPLVYAAVTSLIFLEAAALVGLVIPGETALLVGAALAAHGNISLPALALLACSAAVLGDATGYAVGRLTGPTIEASRLGRWIGTHRWQRAHAYVEQKGSWSVAAGRWVGVLRALVPSIAGMTRMPFRRFLVANVLGGVTWVSVVIALGYAAGGSISAAQGVLGKVSLGVGAVLIAVVAVLLHRRRRAAV